MGAQCNFYVQYKTDLDFWEMIPLYNEKREPVYIWRCGWDFLSAVQEMAYHLPKEDRKMTAIMTGANKYFDKDDDINDNNVYPVYTVSYPYLMALDARENTVNYDATYDENDSPLVEVNEVYVAKSVFQEIKMMINLAGLDYMHPDKFRIIIEVSY